jgi:hypothetical protein
MRYLREVEAQLMAVEKRLDTRSCLLQGDHMGGLCGKPEGKKVRESFLKGDPLYVCVTQSACQSACRLPRA